MSPVLDGRVLEGFERNLPRRDVSSISNKDLINFFFFVIDTLKEKFINGFENQNN